MVAKYPEIEKKKKSMRFLPIWSPLINNIIILRCNCITPKALTTNQDGRPSILYSVHRLVVGERTAAQSHVCVWVRPSTVSQSAVYWHGSLWVRALPSPCWSIVTDRCQDWPRPYRPQKGRPAVLQAQRPRAGWLARAPSGPPAGQPACLPAWARAEEDCSGGGNGGRVVARRLGGREDVNEGKERKWRI